MGREGDPRQAHHAHTILFWTQDLEHVTLRLLTHRPVSQSDAGMIEIENDTLEPKTPAKRDVWQAMGRGLKQRCPACGEGQMFSSYLKVKDTCPACGEELFHQRADDAPPYVTIFIVGHIVVPGILLTEQMFAPATWVQLVIWLPLTLILSLAILARIKGLFVGLQWALRMHGFDPNNQDNDPFDRPETPATASPD